MVINLHQALIFSQLSSIRSDGCTLAFELGVKKYCEMHDHILVHLVSKTHQLNGAQIKYLRDFGLLDITLTRFEADILFRDGLDEKISNEPVYKKPGYWIVKWLYYGAVRLAARFV